MKRWTAGLLIVVILFGFGGGIAIADLVLDVPYFSQRGKSIDEDAWADDDLGYSNLKIKDFGCALTSVAMVLSYYSGDHYPYFVGIGVADDDEVDPGELNEDLKANSGFAPGSGLIRWNKVSDIYEDVENADMCIKGVGYFSTPWDSNNEFSTYENVIGCAIDSGYPLIAKIRRSATECHYFVINGSDFSQPPNLTIHEPAVGFNPDGSPKGSFIPYSENWFGAELDDIAGLIVYTPHAGGCCPGASAEPPETKVRRHLDQQETTEETIEEHTVSQDGISGPFSFFKRLLSRLVLVFHWGGSSLEIEIYRPDGSLYDVVWSENPPVVITIPSGEAEGTWTYRVRGVDVPNDDYPYFVGIGVADDGAPDQTVGGVTQPLSASGALALWPVLAISCVFVVASGALLIKKHAG